MERVSGADPDHGDVRGRGAGVGTEEAGLRTDIAASGISCCRTRMPGATWLKMVIVKVSHDEVDVRFFSADHAFTASRMVCPLRWRYVWRLGSRLAGAASLAT